MQSDAPENRFGYLLEILVAACDRPESASLQPVKPELFAIQQSLLEGGDDAEFSEWLKAHRELHGAIVDAVYKNAMAFVGRQIAQFEGIKKVREFTPEEKAFGMSTLMGVLDSLKRLIDPKKSPGNSSP
jgi:hypothetical protein